VELAINLSNRKDRVNAITW